MSNRQDIDAEIKAIHKGDIQFRLVCEIDKRFGLVSWGYRSEPTAPEGISEEKITELFSLLPADLFGSFDSLGFPVLETSGLMINDYPTLFKTKEALNEHTSEVVFTTTLSKLSSSYKTHTHNSRV